MRRNRNIVSSSRRIVLTIPKMLRIYFRYDRRLLGDLCRVAAGVIVGSLPPVANCSARRSASLGELLPRGEETESMR